MAVRPDEVLRVVPPLREVQSARVLGERRRGYQHRVVAHAEDLVREWQREDRDDVEHDATGPYQNEPRDQDAEHHQTQVRTHERREADHNAESEPFASVDLLGPRRRHQHEPRRRDPQPRLFIRSGSHCHPPKCSLTDRFWRSSELVRQPSYFHHGLLELTKLTLQYHTASNTIEARII